jgi:hypothetical protein
MTAQKPRIVLDAAADVARRIGCHVEIEVNHRTVRISPMAAKGAIFDNTTGQRRRPRPMRRR